MASPSPPINCCCCRQGCHRRAKYACGGCRVEAYCSQECQREHWKFDHCRTCRRERVLATRRGEQCSMSAFWETKPKPASAGEMRVRVRPRLVLLQTDGKYITTGGDAVGVVAPEDIVYHASACLIPGKIWGRARAEPMHIPSALLNLNYPVKSAKQLGKGSYGRVERREFIRSGGGVAIKHINLLPDGELPYGITAELTARNLDHPNVMGMCRGTIGNVVGESGVPEKAVSLVMDLATTDLAHLIASYHAKQKSEKNPDLCVPPEEFPYIAYQLARGVAYCHNNLIDTLDLKPENVLLNGTDSEISVGGTKFKLKRAMLGDLGLARSFADAPTDSLSGSPLYMPPEFLMTDGVRPAGTPLADVWALGFIYCAMALGYHPFKNASSPQELGRWHILMFGLPSDSYLLDRWLPMRSAFIDAADAKSAGAQFKKFLVPKLVNYPGLAELLRSMMRPTPADRPDMNWVLNSEYFAKSGCIDAIERLLPAPREEPVRWDTAAIGRVEPRYAVSVYRRMESSSWKSADDEIKWAGVFKDPTASLVAKWRDAAEAAVSISGAWNADRRVLFSTLALVRQCLVQRAKFATIDETDSAVTALACFKFACESRRRGKYHTEIDTLTSPTYDIIGSIAAPDLAAASQTILMSYLDFNVSIPSAYDFLRVYSRMNVPEMRDPAIASATQMEFKVKYAVATFVTLAACWNRLLRADKPSDIVLSALAAAFSRPMRDETGALAAQPSEETMNALREDGKKFRANFLAAWPTITRLVFRSSELPFLLGAEFFRELKRFVE